MKHVSLILVFFCLTELSPGEILVEEDFEDGSLSARGWTDIAKWGLDRSLSIAGTPEVKPISGRNCLKIRYAEGDTGGWMHIRFPKEVREVYCRYYRLFPADWEWPKGYGPHDSIVFAGSYGVPTDTDLSIYLDFWKTGETFVRGATPGKSGGTVGIAKCCGSMAVWPTGCLTMSVGQILSSRTSGIVSSTTASSPSRARPTVNLNCG